MNKKIDKVIEKIGMILLFITIVSFNLIIGANEKGLRILPISILLAVITIYLVIVKIKSRKESICFKSKIDYLILAFIITTTFPLIFKTYASYSDTIEFIMKYVFFYAVYLLARNTIKTKKQIECVIITTVISSLIPIILYFDYTKGQYLVGILRWFDLEYGKTTNFSSTFGYANAQAIYSCFCVFLVIHRFKINKNKILKLLDIIYILLSIYIIWKTEARVIMFVFGLILVILFSIKYKEQIIKHRNKIILGAISVLCILTLYLVFALNISEDIAKTNEDIEEKIFYRFKKGQEYTLELDLETECLDETRANQKINTLIMQRGKYLKLSVIERGKIDPKSEKTIIKFTSKQDIDFIKIRVYNGRYGKITIKNCYINGQRRIIKYKYLPTKLGIFFSGFHIDGISLQQRYFMYKDCFKIARFSSIFGSGGNAWKNLSSVVEEYYVKLKECHSYFLELLISYGIIGVIAFFSFIIYFFTKVFKQCRNNKEIKKQKFLIALGLVMLLMYNIIFDFGMSFMVLQIIVYVYMAVLLYDDRQSIKYSKNIDYLVLVSLLFILSLYIRADISEYKMQDNNSKYAVLPYKNEYYYGKIKSDFDAQIDYKLLLGELKDYMLKEPYNNQTETYKNYFNIVCENIDKMENSELKNYLKFGIQRLKTIKFATPLYLDTIFNRVGVMDKTIKKLNDDKTEDKERKDIINNAIFELKDIILKEYEVNIKNIEDIENGIYTEEFRNQMKETYKRILSSLEQK